MVASLIDPLMGSGIIYRFHFARSLPLFFNCIVKLLINNKLRVLSVNITLITLLFLPLIIIYVLRQNYGFRSAGSVLLKNVKNIAI